MQAYENANAESKTQLLASLKNIELDPKIKQQLAEWMFNGTSNDAVNDFEFDFNGLSNMLDFTEPSSVNRSSTAGSHKEKNEEKNIDDLLNWAEGL